MNREPDAGDRTGVEASAGGKVGLISRLTKLLQESMLLLAFVALASSILFAATGLIRVK